MLRLFDLRSCQCVVSVSCLGHLPMPLCPFARSMLSSALGETLYFRTGTNWFEIPL